MPIYDEHFGRKLELIEGAVGFRFPANDFSNRMLAQVLTTEEQTMSRKKAGTRLVTEADWSRLTHHFELYMYGFDPMMLGLPLNEFEEVILEVGRRAMNEVRPGEARSILLELARGAALGTITLENKRGQRGGGVGADGGVEGVPHFKVRDHVAIKIKVPADGHMLLLNDCRGREVSCLMPSAYAPDVKVRGGVVRVPNIGDVGHFPVGGPTGAYRIFAIWFAQRPVLRILDQDNDVEPRDLEIGEFEQVAEVARQASVAGQPVMVSSADYIVVA